MKTEKSTNRVPSAEAENEQSRLAPVTGCANDLPEIGTVVLAECKRIDGTIEYHKVRRIKTKDTSKGWQWSGADFNSYFTLEILSWELFCFDRALLEKILDRPARYTSLIKTLSNDKREIINTAANLKIARGHVAWYSKKPDEFWNSKGRVMCEEKINRYSKILDTYFEHCR